MTCDLQSVNRVLEKQQPLISSMKKLQLLGATLMQLQ
jgi:hypothetical protein